MSILTWMLHLLSYDPFNFGRRRIKMKYEPIHRKMLIYKQFIPLLDITVLTITD
jgi:hypothetical protein